MFWSRANSTRAPSPLLLGSVGLNIVVKFAMADLPFVIRIWVVFLACLVLGGGRVVRRSRAPKAGERLVPLGDVQFRDAPDVQYRGAGGHRIAFVGIYIVFW